MTLNFWMHAKSRVVGCELPSRRETHQRIEPLSVGMACALATGIGVLTVFQGGFYALPTCLVGVSMSVVSIAYLVVGRMQCTSIVPAALLVAVGIAAFASAWMNGATLSMLAHASCWFAMAAVGLVATLTPQRARAWAIEALCWIGVTCALIGAIDLACGSLFHPVRVSDRLEFPFQYANASGAWFAAVAMLCAASGKRRLVSVACIPLTALLLTRSVGALCVLCAASLLLAFWHCRKGRAVEVVGGVVSLLLAFVVFAATFAIGFWFGPLGMCLGVVAYVALGRIAATHRARIGELETRLGAAWKWAPVIALAVLFALVALLGVVMLPERLAQSRQTLVERFIQINDGLGLFATSPLLGIGPDAWSWTYPFVQSAQYQAGAIHCGYLQIALDAGVLGLGLFVVFVVLGIVRLVKVGEAAQLASTCVLLLHALLDFDFAFSAVLALIVLLMFVPVDAGAETGRGEGKGDSAAAPNSPRRAVRLVLPATLGVMCALACVSGAVSASTVMAAYDAGLAGDLGAVESLVGSTAFAADDVPVRTSLCAARLRSSDIQGTVSYVDGGNVQSAEQALLCAAGLFQAGDGIRAGEVLVREMEREPYNVELFKQAASLFGRFGVDSLVEPRYRQAVERANAFAREGNAALLDNQVDDLPLA